MQKSPAPEKPSEKPYIDKKQYSPLPEDHVDVEDGAASTVEPPTPGLVEEEGCQVIGEEF